MKRLLEAAFSRELPSAPFPDYPANGIAAFGDFPTLSGYLAWRSEPVTSLTR